MIARLWRGRTERDRIEAYLDVVHATGVTEQRKTPGNVGSWVFWREAEGKAEVLVLSLWDSRESIEAFAGSDPGRARYYPRDDEFLLEKPEEVFHYEVAIGEGSPRRRRSLGRGLRWIGQGLYRGGWKT